MTELSRDRVIEALKGIRGPDLNGNIVDLGMVRDVLEIPIVGTVPAIKPAAERRLIGKPVMALDVAGKIDGSAVYGIDAKVDGMVIFVDGGVPGDIADVMITRKKNSYAEGHIVTLKKQSPNRIDHTCEHFGVCGGCKWQNLSYEIQLKFKQKKTQHKKKQTEKNNQRSEYEYHKNSSDLQSVSAL